MSSWRCPYCQQIASDAKTSNDTHYFNAGNKDGDLALGSHIRVCPNDKCKDYTIWMWLQPYKRASNGNVLVGEKLGSWQLRPQSSAKPIPEFVPQAIRSDYAEACSIVALSPKASATLARRCLQGMVRDFQKVKEKNLYLEIQAIKDEVDQTTWEAIDAVRSIGNIGAHMEADIDVIVDVDPGEAALLINLIETLIDEWYVHRHEREQRMTKIVAIAAAKKAEKDARKDESAQSEPSTPETVE